MATVTRCWRVAWPLAIFWFNLTYRQSVCITGDHEKRPRNLGRPERRVYPLGPGVGRETVRRDPGARVLLLQSRRLARRPAGFPETDRAAGDDPRPRDGRRDDPPAGRRRHHSRPHFLDETGWSAGPWPLYGCVDAPE